MKIAWFTPLHEDSIIARYSQVVLEELTKSHTIDLLAPKESNYYPKLDFNINTSIYSLENLPYVLSNYDFSVFNMGNSVYHVEVWDALLTCADNLYPSVVILHDWSNIDFFYAYYLLKDGNLNNFFELFKIYYGTAKQLKLKKIFPKNLKNYNQYLKIIRNSSFLEAILDKSNAVICHSQFSLNKLPSNFSGKKYELFLPTAISLKQKQYKTIKSKEELGIPPNTFVIVSIGYCNKNRLTDIVLKAIKKTRKKMPKFSYHIVGQIGEDYLRELKKICRKYELNNIYFTENFVENEDLHSYLCHADLCINLRRPCFEGASASIIDILTYGKPCIISNDGCYKDLPSDCVVKITPYQEEKELKKILPALANNLKLCHEIGLKGKNFLEENNDIKTYRQKFDFFSNEFNTFCNKLNQSKNSYNYFKNTLENIELYNNNFFLEKISKKISDLTNIRIKRDKKEFLSIKGLSTITHDHTQLNSSTRKIAILYLSSTSCKHAFSKFKNITRMIKRGSQLCGDFPEITAFILKQDQNYRQYCEELENANIHTQEFHPHTISQEELKSILNKNQIKFSSLLHPKYLLPTSNTSNLLDYDLWIVVGNDTCLPLAPAIPYGLIVPDFYQPNLSNFFETIRNAFFIICNTSFTKEYIKQYAGINLSKIHLFPIEVDLPKYNKITQNPFKNKDYFLMLNNNLSFKNNIIIWDSLKIYYEDYKGKLEIVVIENSTQKTSFTNSFSSIKNASNLENIELLKFQTQIISEKITFTNILNYNDYLAILINSKFIWIPELIDDLPHKIYEAISYQIPCLSSLNSSLLDIEQQLNLGLLFCDINNSEDIAKKLKKMEIYHEKIKQSLPHSDVILKFSWGALASSFWQKIYSLLQN